MGTCSICHRISAGGDHLDCQEKMRLMLEDENSKEGLPERLGSDPSDLAVEMRAFLDHLAREKGKDS
ncbi:hypothetical protein CENSYa_1858 [Cenarchaeum symbiosum A]|uniref:Uncharacterized protein n=1 Tax=Cenarchaeum symbiosum (strain A) TaxID=414004 RepID=A0RYQ1_CENSY|nr:hypothetical protein CENSYa_1858 [Cenarchaeum symbiosum A]